MPKPHFGLCDGHHIMVDYCYTASVAASTGSMIDGSSFSGLLTRAEIGHIRKGRPEWADVARRNHEGLRNFDIVMAKGSLRMSPRLVLKTTYKIQHSPMSSFAGVIATVKAPELFSGIL
jgi:hypothetical protein